MSVSTAGAVLDTLAAARLVRLITRDRILSPIRERIIEAAYVKAGRADEAQPGGPQPWADHVEVDEDPPKLAYLVTCPWCAGIWSAALTAVLPRPVKRLLAVALVASVLDVLSDRA